ncbi:MAG: hypothetical protein LBV04_09435, partial [Deferribacteraceae bacterium]|nr:hypothetical protein [Deferribacteraceae bacterium]
LNNITEAERFVSFPDITGEPLYLRDIEQGLDQMNRLPSNKVTLSIQPSASNGFSNIILDNARSDNTFISASIDNLGSESTGEWRYGVRLTQESLLGINDRIDLGYNRSKADHKEKGFNSFTAGLSLPFRYLTLNNNFSYSDYLTSYVLQQSGERFYTLGDSINNNISLDYLYMRGKTHKLSISVGQTYKRSRNYMKVLDFQTKNEASSRALASVYLELPSTFYLPSGVLYFKPSIVKGVDMFGGLDDDQVPYPQTAQYRAWKAYLYYSHSFSKANLALTADGQYSEFELYGSEGFSIGGEGTVRGFKEFSGVGDKGIVLKTELSSNLGTLFGQEFLQPYRLAVFYDWGSASSNSTDIERVKLAGMGASLSMDYGFINASITYAKALSKPDDCDESTALYCRLGLHYSF